jgi:hypothetical protein
MAASSASEGKPSLHRNPFHVLGATTRDGRNRVIDLADERSLVGDESACRDAQNALINLRGRLAAEMGWFPGVAPRKASEMAEGVQAASLPPTATELPPLARANVLAAHLESLPPGANLTEAGKVILRLTNAVEEVDGEEVLRDINEDRSVAGYQPVRDASLVADEFEARKRAYRDAVRDYLDRLPSRTLVKVVDGLVDRGTDGGKRQVPAVIQDLVDTYETSAQDFIEREAGNVLTLVERARAAIPRGEADVIKAFEDIERTTLNFNAVARPIQVVNQVNGTDHAPSIGLARTIRQLGVELYNEHGWHELPSRITAFLASAFPRLGEIQETVAADADYLRTLAEERRAAEEQGKEYERSMEYAAEIGVLFKDKVCMTAQAIEWKNQRFPLDAVTRIRWGATRHSVNGVPTGTTYTVVVGDAASAMTIGLRNATVYDNLVERLWKAVGIRLVLELVRRVRETGSAPIPNGAIRDDGVILRRRKLFGSGEDVLVPWSAVTIWSQAGSFVIAKRDETKVQTVMSYQGHDNTLVVENLIRAFFKSDKPRLTQLFE